MRRNRWAHWTDGIPDNALWTREQRRALEERRFGDIDIVRLIAMLQEREENFTKAFTTAIERMIEMNVIRKGQDRPRSITTMMSAANELQESPSLDVLLDDEDFLRVVWSISMISAGQVPLQPLPAIDVSEFDDVHHLDVRGYLAMVEAVRAECDRDRSSIAKRLMGLLKFIR